MGYGDYQIGVGLCSLNFDPIPILTPIFINRYRLQEDILVFIQDLEAPLHHSFINFLFQGHLAAVIDHSERFPADVYSNRDFLQ